MAHKNEFAKFYGNMEWFDVDDDTSDLKFPPAFEQARSLWSLDSVKNQETIIELLAPYVRAWFVPEGIDGSEELFRDVGDFELWEKHSPATEVKVVGIDFSTDPFPKCKAEAWFTVPVTQSFSTMNVEEWLEDRGESLYQAISFGWEIPNDDGVSMVFTWANHAGAEGVLLV